MKTFILGLDGATFDQLNPLMEQGYLPTLKSMCEQGACGPLVTVFPPVTAPAWLSIATGLNPGKTGIFDYINKTSPDKNYVTAVSSAAYANRAIWNYLNSTGYKTGLFNYPTLFPPPPLKGFVVSGMGAHRGAPLCYPDELNKEISSMADGYDVSLNLRNRKYARDINLFFDDLNSIRENQKKLLLHLIKNKQWDFFFAVFSFTDWMQHVLWKDFDENHPLYNPNTSPAIQRQYKQQWQKVDQIIAELLSLLPPDTNFIIVSDHGSGPLDSVFYSNSWLRQNDWLKRKNTSLMKSIIADTFTALSESHDNKYTTRLSSFIKRKLLHIRSTVDLIDMEHSLAYAPEHNTMFGCINLTQKGKAQPGFKEELIKGLRNLPDKFTDITSVQILLPEDIYSGPYTNLSPDIFFIINDYRSTVEIPFNHKVFEKSPSIDLRTGGHRPHGIFIAKGTVFRKTAVRATVFDLAPTILALYNMPIPEKMDGKVLTGCLTDETLNKLNIRFGKGLDDISHGKEENGDLDTMKDLLKSLGYM